MEMIYLLTSRRGDGVLVEEFIEPRSSDEFALIRRVGDEMWEIGFMRTPFLGVLHSIIEDFTSSLVWEEVKIQVYTSSGCIPIFERVWNYPAGKRIPLPDPIEELLSLSMLERRE